MWLLYLFAIVAGIGNAFQSGVNSTLAKTLGQPFFAMLTVFGVGALVVVAAGIASGRFAVPGSFSDAPWWAWTGGFLAVLLLMSQLFVADSIGASAYLGIIVVTGTLTSLVIDHFGLIGFDVHRLNLARIIGGTLMAAGVLLIAIF